MERINTFELWLEKEGLPVIRYYSVPDLMAVDVKPWARKGGFGAFMHLVGAEAVISGYICEIPPGGSLLPQRHLYEELIYILSGYGATTVWVEGSGKQTFEWQEGSLFAPPLNSWHQHFNGQSDKAVRYVGMTRAPVFMNLFHDLDFIFNNAFVFAKRYHGEEGYFSVQGKPLEPRSDLTPEIPDPKIWESNFIPDCRTFPLAIHPKRGGFSTFTRFQLSDGLMCPHMSEHPGGTYAKAHHHGGGTHLLCLGGQGYTLMWPAESGKMAQGVKRLKIDVKKNSIFSPPSGWFHQHFNTGIEPTRFLALHPEKSPKYKGLLKESGAKYQVEFEDEDPEIRRFFKEELAKTGAPWRMSEFFPGE